MHVERDSFATVLHTAYYSLVSIYNIILSLGLEFHSWILPSTFTMIFAKLSVSMCDLSLPHWIYFQSFYFQTEIQHSIIFIIKTLVHPKALRWKFNHICINLTLLVPCKYLGVFQSFVSSTHIFRFVITTPMLCLVDL